MVNRVALSLFLLLATSGAAHAVCGDVTGDGERLASDALAVLRAAVGQSVPLECSCEDCVTTTTVPSFCCGGTAATCGMTSGKTACQAHSGCIYDQGAGLCIGGATPCGSFSTEQGCLGQTGCSEVPCS
jgi:hypothetical protein